MPTFLGQLQTGCNWLRTKYTRIHLSTEWDCFFPENWTDFLFQGLPEDIQSKIVYIYSVINEYSLRSQDVHSTPSWHKWSDFEYRPWCLAIVVRTPPGFYLRVRIHLRAFNGFQIKLGENWLVTDNVVGSLFYTNVILELLIFSLLAEDTSFSRIMHVSRPKLSILIDFQSTGSTLSLHLNSVKGRRCSIIRQV